LHSLYFVLGFTVDNISGYFYFKGTNMAKMKSGAMIREDMSKVANMPSESKQVAYPSRPVMMQYSIEDNIMGQDMQIRGDVGQLKKHSSKNRY
jgi:hypothetical protein